MKTIGIYQSNLSQIGGVETFLYNWCWWLRNYFDVTVIYCTGDAERIRKMSNIVKMVQYSEQDKFEFDVVIRNSVWGTIPDKIYSKENRYIEMRHANYKYLLDEGLLYQQYHEWDKTNEIVSCGDFVAKMSNEVLHDNPTAIKNILLPKRETNKILKLISCTRLDPAKGWNRMLKMMDMMRKAGIKFEWNIFTNSTMYKCNYEEVHFYKQRYDIWDYLANADYTVLLSDSEGLSYTVQESLQYEVPVICTNVGGNAELIKDGINGYLVPLDMGFDINKIKKIPKCSKYENGALEKWLEYLKYDGKKIDKDMLIQNFKEEDNMKVKVEAIEDFSLEAFGEIQNLKRLTPERAREGWLYKGDIFECDESLYKYLDGGNAKGLKVVNFIEMEFLANAEIDGVNCLKATCNAIQKASEKMKTTKKKKSSKK